MDSFLLLKLNRSIWVALLEQQKIVEGISYFEGYCNDLSSICKNKKYKSKVEEEIKISMALFVRFLKRQGAIFFENKDYSNALICYTAVFKYDQTDFDVIKNYIKSLSYIGLYDLEIELLKHFESNASENNEIYRLIGEAYAHQKNIAKAIEIYEKYLSGKPEGSITASEWNQLGCYYNTYYSEQTLELGDALRSLKCFEYAAELEPKSRLYHKNATIMATKSNEFEISRKHWDKLLELNVLNNDDKYDYAAFCLRTSNFEQWHKYYDSRFEKEHNRTYYPQIKKPKWDGKKKLTKSTLLVHCEQGFGDTFLVWGHISKLTKYAKKVIFVVQDQIYDLLKDNEFGIEIYAKSQVDLEKIEFDYHIPSMSVATALKLVDDQLCVGGGYITADEILVRDYKQKYFENDKLKIGIAFSGNISGNKTRNIALEQLLQLEKIKGAEIYSLTKDIQAGELQLFEKHSINNLSHELTTFAHTAALIENCDIIISTDNCILNLAGAMGKTTYGLFNSHYDFRWFGLPKGESGWYSTVKVYVNDKMNNWAPSIANIINEIESKYSLVQV